ncbi:putative helicase mov-10-B.2 [Anabas testudineus]|uniref:RNA helicase n=1 Tax=Anabas testudineus TaxID=64144 RepID=A0A7N6A9K0_ANATE|nr:putative helicase mov-10-B.2 [Anabas testudineus]
MSSVDHQQRKPQMFPAGWSAQKTGPGRSGGPHEPQNMVADEAQMAKQARQKIRARLKMAKLFQQYRGQIISNQYGVTVTSDPASTQDKIRLTVYENKTVVLFTVKNSGARKVYLTFWASDLVQNIFTVRDSNGNIIKTIKQHILGPGAEYKIGIHFCSEHAGFYEQLLVFTFKAGQRPSDKFKIVRLLEVIHWTSFSEELPPTATNSLCDLQAMTQTQADSAVLKWRKPDIPLKQYGKPDNLNDVRELDRELQKRPLNWKNYSWRFHLLLDLEELRLKTEIEKYNVDNVPMFRHKDSINLLFLQFADIFKNLSSLGLTGHQVLVSPLDQTGVFENRFYKGWVNHVDVMNVYLRFNNKLFLCNFKDGMRFNIIFAINRLPLLIQHRAVAHVYRHRLKEVLFPTGQQSSHHSHLHRLLEVENPEQRTAIQHIVSCSAKPAPYLVFGPPGTGKTMTLVEAMKQIVRTQASCTILACAPSNSAADHLCEKILESDIDKDKVFRLYALTFPVTNIPASIKSCCNLNQDTQTAMIPSKEALMKYKIMVTTLLTAERLVARGIPAGHYTYIFVDEAGQAAEPECIVPIAGLLKPQRCQVVLAGDLKQLGPVITFRMAEKHGLGVSLLERLMKHNNLYKAHDIYRYNTRFVTKLLRNYRSHPAILKIPNELFYKGELQPYALKKNCNSYCMWERLPKKGFPLIFHGVAGTDERDANSPSVYNMAEVAVLKEYLKSLIDHLHRKGTTKIVPGEIGIIAPYKKQVEKIRNALQMDKDLRGEDLENVLVGSVEQFQGKEFNIILVSTVRSNPKLTAHNQQFTLGFVNNAKRFNVAITRARALLIVVGDPRVLKTDQIWNKFIHYCQREGAYRGITVSDAEEDSLSAVLSGTPSGRVMKTNKIHAGRTH